jgi:hypothetical protein
MKLSKFELEKKMSIADMKSIKAGCGDSSINATSTHCTGSDHITGSTDRD